jgi:hypothetical protein
MKDAVMNKHVAAILFGAILPAMPLSAQGAMGRPPLGTTPPLTTLRPAFDELPAIRRVKAREVVGFAMEDGRLLALWSGRISAPEPMRLETPDLDAEWMAHAPLSPPGGRFSLVRRDLQPSADGRSWLIQLRGWAERPETIQIIASGAARPADSAGTDSVSVLLAQDSNWTSLRMWRKPAGDVRLCGRDLSAIAAVNPLEYGAVIRPLLERLTALELP